MTSARDRAIEAVECMRDACSTDEERVEYLTALLDELVPVPAPEKAVAQAKVVRRATAALLDETDKLLGQVEDLARDVSARRAEAETFEEAWERTGYQYGEDALENVRLGWELARGEASPPKKPALAPDRDPCPDCLRRPCVCFQIGTPS